MQSLIDLANWIICYLLQSEYIHMVCFILLNVAQTLFTKHAKCLLYIIIIGRLWKV